jgi:hypothetical protein
MSELFLSGLGSVQHWSRVLDDTYKLAKCVKIALLYLEVQPSTRTSLDFIQLPLTRFNGYACHASDISTNFELDGFY